MMGKLIDGKRVAKQAREAIAAKVAQRVSEGKRVPGLAVIIVGEDPASQVYVRNKERASKAAGFKSEVIRMDASVAQAELLAEIDRLNADPSIDGILVQLPLPRHLDENMVLARIEAAKDVDGFHTLNAGALFTGQTGTIACTPKGILRLLDVYEVPVAGKHAVVVGRSNIVGKPAAMLLLSRNATVTLCHSRTEDLALHTRMADILVVAVGSKHLITPEMIKPGAVVIDAGINRVDGVLYGDVDTEGAMDVVSLITPVPGGVGPMTIAMLLENTLEACERHG